MASLYNIANFFRLGVISASKFPTKYEQHEYLRNYIILVKYTIHNVSYIKRVRSMEFKYENEKYIEQINHRPRRTKSLCVKVFPSNMCST